MPKEIEAKFLDIDADSLRAKLKGLGFECTRPWSLMRRYTFMLNEIAKPADVVAQWARVRDEGDKVTMTLKRVADESVIDQTEETEFEVSNFESAVKFMQRLGFHDFAFQESYRESWHKDDLEVTLNEWPGIKVFAEVEAPSEAQVRDLSQLLKFDYNTALFSGVSTIYDKKLGISNAIISNIKELTFANVAEVAKLTQKAA